MEYAVGHVIGIISPVKNGLSCTYIVEIGVKFDC